jgi:hypothetical protein
MGWWRKFLQSNFIIKFRNWEYWPFGIVQFPIFFYYPWLSLRAGSFTFFAASNPGIVMGGMFGESKYDVLKLLPPEIRPGSVLIRAGTNASQLDKILLENDLHFPVIFKPDIGERGFMVRRINSTEDAHQYLTEMRHDFIAQEFVSLPLEFGVFYSRLPEAMSGKVTSIVAKEMLTVEGDGKSTLQELILTKDRAKLQWETLRKKFNQRLNDVIPAGEKVEIVSIGNHCLGTKFINGNNLINDTLNLNFDRIAKAIPGFYFGRFDIRCNSVEDLQSGKIVVMELNGCGAEPAHIYDPNFSFWKAVGILIGHWKTIFTIARQNKKSGIEYLSLSEAIKHYHNFKEKTK